MACTMMKACNHTLIVSQIFVTISVADFKLSPTTGTACTTEPRTSSAVIA
jgi:hypothetical protein